MIAGVRRKLAECHLIETQKILAEIDRDMTTLTRSRDFYRRHAERLQAELNEGVGPEARSA